MSGFENERYLVVFDGEKFDVTEDWDFRPSLDIPMTDPSGDLELIKQRKRAFEFVADYIDIKEVVNCFRVDLIKEKALADAAKL